MTGDRLAEIEKRARLWAEDDGRSDNAIIELWRIHGKVLARDALALVDVARTAIENAEQNPVTYAHRKALARLDALGEGQA